MKIFLFIVFYSSLIIGQPFNKFIFTENIVVPDDSSSSVYFTFRIPYQNLIFEKEGNNYKAGLRLYLEITDTNSNFIKREIKDWNYSVSSFEQTNSPEIFAEGLLNFNLDNGSYFILPIATDKNTHREFKLERIRMDISDETSKYLSPIITGLNEIDCEGKNLFRLANFGGNIPFDKNEYNIIIPFTDISVNNIDITVISGKDTVFTEGIADIYIDKIDFFECENKIFLNSGGTSDKTKNILLSGISRRLKEGSFTILINGSDEKIQGEVFWYNKPVSLRKPDFAIKTLKYIESEDIIDSILKEEKQNQYSALVNYWKIKDPTPETEYNELMVEYYTRVDYAEKNFAFLNGKGGLESDRGKIYVKFGKPSKIERGYNEQGKVIETWFFEQVHRRFVFVDKHGLGEFSLESS